MPALNSSIEPLESRIAPATLIDARTVSFTDLDGDLVKVVFSKDVFLGAAAAQLAKANEVFNFSTGTVLGTADATAQQLRLIDLTKLPANSLALSLLNGLSFSVTATQAGAGDGFVDVGAVKGNGLSLGKVTIAGDLGQIDAGASNQKVGIASLNVQSIGARGTATQISTGDLVSTITAELTALNVAGDVKYATIKVVDGTVNPALANIGSITIKGSLLGNPLVATGSDNSGLIECARSIGVVKIGTDGSDGIIGGGGLNSGRITAGSKISSIVISGDLQGADGQNSGSIYAANSIGSITVGGSLKGAVVAAGKGASSGFIQTLGNLTSLNIGGGLFAGTGYRSASVLVQGVITTGIIHGNIDGTAGGVLTGATAQTTSGIDSASVAANGFTKFSVAGSVNGGAGADSGRIHSDQGFNAVTISGNLQGGNGAGSGVISANGLAKSITVSGDVLGGDGIRSGSIQGGILPTNAAGITKVVVGGTTNGGDGNYSGSIISGSKIKSVTLGKNLASPITCLSGGEGDFSGIVSANGKISTVKLLGGIAGGGGDYSGAILSYDSPDTEVELSGSIGKITLAGSLTGGEGANSGLIQADGNIGTIALISISGGTGAESASIRTGTGNYEDGNITSIKITSGLAQAMSTPGAGSAAIEVGGKLGTLTVGTHMSGSTVIVGESLKALKVGGNVSNTSILAGYNLLGVAVNPDAQIGKVSVAGDWTASNLVAGAAVGTDAGFGNVLDVKASGFDSASIVSKIASVVIGGSVTGSVDGNFGFVAQVIGKMKVGTQSYTLNALADTQVYEVGDLGSGVFLREIPLV